MPALPRLRLRITATAETILRQGHPWLFAQSIREQNREGIAGELAVVFDRHDQFLAVGLFDPDSPIRVRILHRGKPVAIEATWWRENLRKALQRREFLFGSETTGYRCIHGESDGWPGLVLDRYAETLVLKIYSAAWFPRLAEIVPLLQEALPDKRIVLRCSRNIEPAAAAHGFNPAHLLSGSAVETPVIFRENQLQFEADIWRGQKTGFFLDQRDNRAKVQTLSAGRDALNAFSFSGGFSVYAARGGARSVCSVDISEHALKSAERNFDLNSWDERVKRCRHERIAADVFEWLGTVDRRFDLIVLDPPSLAKKEIERPGAIAAYGRLAGNAIDRLHPEGILVACSCSAHVSADEFFSQMRTAAQLSGRSFRELETTGQSPDHPATFKEAEYLKAIYLQF